MENLCVSFDKYPYIEERDNVETRQIKTRNRRKEMSESTVSVPLLESGEHGEEGSRVRWWNKVLDVEETKNQVLFSLPMILSNVFYYLITLVSVMFAGHLGDLELAGATLANSWAVVTGFAFMVTLSLSLSPVPSCPLIYVFTLKL